VARNDRGRAGRGHGGDPAAPGDGGGDDVGGHPGRERQPTPREADEGGDSNASPVREDVDAIQTAPRSPATGEL